MIERIIDALTETATQLASGGRVYGGGLNKIEPRELQAIQLPRWLEEENPRLIEFQLSPE